VGRFLVVPFLPFPSILPFPFFSFPQLGKMDLESKILASLEASGDDPEPQRGKDDTDSYDLEDTDHDHEGQGEGDDDSFGDEDGTAGRPPQGPQTGVKGVLNDRKQYNREMREQDARDAQELMEKLRRAAITLSMLPQDGTGEEDDLDDVGGILLFPLGTRTLTVSFSLSLIRILVVVVVVVVVHVCRTLKMTSFLSNIRIRG